MFFCKIKSLVVLVVTILSFCLPTRVYCQYYFKDVWNTNQLNKDWKKLKDENIRLISMKSFEDDGSSSEGFFCERRIDKEFTLSTTTSRSYITGNSITFSYYNDAGMIIKVIDSNSSSVNRTDYAYDHKRLKAITTYTHTADSNDIIKEIHEFTYNETGFPIKLIRKKNGKEVSNVDFTIDKSGNVIEEQEIVGGQPVSSFFYYYDEKNHLTDVVRKTDRKMRLLPDYVFEYDARGNEVQMINTDAMTSNYFIWKYNYDDRNFRTSEICYSKERRLLGRIEYNYKK